MCPTLDPGGDDHAGGGLRGPAIAGNILKRIMKTPTLLEMLKAALYIGTVGYGGPAILASMKRVIVHEKKWISEEEFLNALSLAQILPGATFIGYKVKGIIGDVVSTVGIFCPSLALMMLVSRAHAKIKELKIVKVTIKGFLSGFIGLLLSDVLQFGVQSLVSWQTWSVFGVSVLYLLVWKKDVVWLILGTIAVSLLVF